MGKLMQGAVRLHAEPRLWGVLVLDDPRNPAEWRGMRLPFERVGSYAGVVWRRHLLDEAGEPLVRDGKRVQLTFTEEAGRVLNRATRHDVRRRLKDGTLNFTHRTMPMSRTDKIVLCVMAPVMLALMAFVAVAIVRGHATIPRSHLEWYDLPVKLSLVVVPLLLYILVGWIVWRSSRRTCRAVRVTSEAITPLDRAHSGKPIERSAVVRYKFGQESVRVWTTEGTHQFQCARWFFIAWMGSDELERRRTRRSYVRCGIYLAVTLPVIIVFACVLPRPDPDPNIQRLEWWQGVLLFGGLLGFCAVMLGYVLPRMVISGRRRERATRRKYRLAAKAAVPAAC
ncbi:MAG: hypothetical protein QM783_04020 [Phycisphaerales bacterium]